MLKFEEYLRQHAYYGVGQNLVPTDLGQLLSQYELQPIGKGHFSRVYVIRGLGWVVKEGRWDLDFEIIRKLTLPVHAKLTESFLSLFRLRFLPSEGQIIDQYNKYLELSKFLGYFESEKAYTHLYREKIFAVQKEFRSNLEVYIQLVEREFNLNISAQFKVDVASSKFLRAHNYLPKEYLLYGPAMHRSGRGKNTSYIFQQHVEGKPLYSVESVTTEQKSQLLLFAIAVLAFAATKGYVPDLRPKYLASSVGDWVWKTENLFMADRGAVLVDTRWLWSLNDNLVKRGFVIPELTINALKSFVNSA
ncbi:MAG: hypothetical protein QY318_00410 [Candidatus Dojkabacteria bacterium]|nr:MAG: hypothetical protein QY318_00410 [Candidatus Dojkabacteria bacterium]